MPIARAVSGAVGERVMERHGDDLDLNEEEASGGTKGHGVRWVLLIGLLLAIAAMSLIWIVPALEG
jgi:hypothetical protein